MALYLINDSRTMQVYVRQSFFPISIGLFHPSCVSLSLSRSGFWIVRQAEVKMMSLGEVLPLPIKTHQPRYGHVNGVRVDSGVGDVGDPSSAPELNCRNSD